MEHLTDEHLQQIWNDNSTKLAKYGAMSEEEKRRSPGGKGDKFKNPPISSIHVSAMIWQQAGREMEHRGLLEKGFVDGED